VKSAKLGNIWMRCFVGQIIRCCHSICSW